MMRGRDGFLVRGSACDTNVFNDRKQEWLSNSWGQTVVMRQAGVIAWIQTSTRDGSGVASCKLRARKGNKAGEAP